MGKENHENGENLPLKLDEIKKKIERDMVLRIKEALKLNKSNVSSYALQTFTQSGVSDTNGRDNNMLSLRMTTPLQHFKGFSHDNIKETDIHNALELPSVELPNVEIAPRSITRIFTDRNQLMAESDSVIGKIQIHYVDGEATQLSCNEKDGKDKEKTEKEKLEFSKHADQFIWELGQKYGLDDQVMLSALTKFLEVDDLDVMERYNELKMLKNEENVGDTSGSKSESIISSFSNTIDKLFCRRCLIFNCRMHEKSLHVTKSKGTKYNLSGDGDVREPCREHCYLKQGNSVTEANTDKEKNVLSFEWTPVEIDLYLEGVEIFGKNSCLITTNLLAGLKSCVEVYNYMREQDQITMLPEHNQIAEKGCRVNKEVPRKSTLLVHKKNRKASFPVALRRIAKGEDKRYNQYTPCTCDPTCGDQCACLASGNCCEKYCGCTTICKNKFGGCSCAKGQCSNRQCPCYAANRECDPDVCQRCWFSCGDCDMGETSKESQDKCKNMNILRKQHKRILLGKSDIDGWGAFTRHSIKKNEFIGEYTGELISHEEAEDRARPGGGNAYLFNVNDQFEIDARRKGNKTRFFNHSPTPNCEVQFMIVRGDHRIGIYANREIEAGEELFFDYAYEPEQADWFQSRKPRKTADSTKSKHNYPRRKTIQPVRRGDPPK